MVAASTDGEGGSDLQGCELGDLGGAVIPHPAGAFGSRKGDASGVGIGVEVRVVGQAIH